MPGRARGRAPVSRPDDRQDDYGYGYDESFDDDRADAPPRGRAATTRGRNGAGRNGARNGRPAGDEPEPLYARDHTPLGYDGGDPDDPPLLTHGGRDDRAPADHDEYDDEYDEDDDYDEDDADEYDEDDYSDDEDYDDDAYGVGDGPLAVPPPGSGGRPLGPADVEELDPSMTDALARVDLGSMQVPVPFGAQLVLEPAESGRPQAAHIMLPEGRIAVSALAAPRTSALWPDLADEIEESLRGGGARVRTATGDWGRELHARTETASSVFIGADGPRWMVYGVATASLETIEALDVELRRVMRGIIVVRGKLPYPPRTVLPLQKAEDRERAAAENKPRGASITVSVPAARSAGASGPTPAAGAAAPAEDGTAARNGAARNGTSRNGASRNGAPGGGMAGAGRGAPPGAPRGGRPDPERNGASRNGASRNGVGRNGVAPNGAGRPGPQDQGRTGDQVRDPRTPVRRPAAEAPPTRRGPGSAGAAGGRPAPDAEQTQSVRAAGSTGAQRTGRTPQAPPDDASATTRTAVPGRTGRSGNTPVRPAGADGGPDSGATRRTRGDAVPGTPRRGDTGAAPLRPVADETGHLPVRGATARPERDAPFAGRVPADTGAPPSRPAPAGDAREPEYEPDAPVTRMLPTVDAPGAGHTGANPAVAPLPEPGPTVDELPRSRGTRRRPGAEDADDVADTPRRTVRDTGRARVGRRAESREPVEPTAVPAATPEPADVPPVDTVEEPPVRRDPAVISLLDPGIAFPDLPGTPRVGRGRRHADDATTPPAGRRAVVEPPAATDDLLAGLRGDPRNDPPADPLSAPLGDLPGDDEATPRGGTRYEGADLWSGDPAPLFPEPEPDPVPISRMAIGDIPLADVPLLDAELDSEPQPVPVADVLVADAPVAGTERAQLPRRRPGATRRRGAVAPSEEARAGRRRRAAEDDVLSDWMSAEIAARPSGRHAQPGAAHAGPADADAGAHGRASTNGTSRRSRADDRTGPDADLFRPLPDDGPDGDSGRHRR